MEILQLSSPDELMGYKAWLSGHSDRSLWQSLEWQRFQEALGRSTKIYALMDGKMIHASAIVCIDRGRGGIATWDIPRGPLWDKNLSTHELERFLHHIVDDAKSAQALRVTLSPLHPLPISIKRVENSTRLVQPQATRIISLRGSEDEILNQMKQKGRYNIRLAEKHGIVVTESKDALAFAHIAKKTAARDKFTGHGAPFYQTFLDRLPGSFLLLAFEKDRKEPLAGMIGVTWEQRGIYYYGASDHDKRHLMAPYLLQWEAMRHCKKAGCADYDLFGIAPASAPDHPWTGISAFKEKFGGIIVDYPAEQQITLRPLTNSLLKIKRKLLG